MLKPGLGSGCATVYSILIMIKDDLERQTKRSCALPPLLQLCVSLRFFAEGCFYMMLGDYCRISPASIHRCVKGVAMAFKRRANNFIKIPSSRAMDRIKEEFHEIAGLFSLFMQTIIITSLITHHWAPSGGHQCSTPAACCCCCC